MKRNLLADFVASVKPPESGQKPYWDAKLPGFALRVSCGGGKTWVFAYRHNKRMRWMVLGTYPSMSLADARAAAHTARGAAQRGEDPATDRKAQQQAQAANGVRFADLADLYLRRHAMEHKRTWKQDDRVIKHDLLPAWGSRGIADITRADVVMLLDQVFDRGAKVMANRVLTLVSGIFAFAIHRGMIDENPAAKVARPGKEDPRERVLTDDEVRRIWTVLDTRDEELDRFVPIIRLGLLTGQREGEIMGMRWSELDLEHGWWTIPGERTKNGLIHRVPLVGEALAVLKGIFAGQHDSVLVFPGGRRGQPLRSVYKPMLRLKKLSSVGGFRYHDLRRTARTGWASIGIDDSLAERLLNHKDRGVQGVYNRYKYDADKRAALARWDRWMREIAKGQVSEKVVQLHA